MENRGWARIRTCRNTAMDGPSGPLRRWRTPACLAGIFLRAARDARRVCLDGTQQPSYGAQALVPDWAYSLAKA
jgi:hypothetical protein